MHDFSIYVYTYEDILFYSCVFRAIRGKSI
jgi:hypothetical protein